MSGRHIIPANQKLMRYEDWKIHIAEVERCQKHTQTKSVPPVFFPEISEKMKPCNSNPEIANAGALKTTSTPSPSMSAFSPHLHQFRHDLQQQAIPELHPDSRTLLAHIHKKFFFRDTWRLIEMAKWVLAEPTTDTASAWDEVISPCRITLFSDILWNSNTWLSNDGFTCSNH